MIRCSRQIWKVSGYEDGRDDRSRVISRFFRLPVVESLAQLTALIFPCRLSLNIWYVFESVWLISARCRSYLNVAEFCHRRKSWQVYSTRSGVLLDLRSNNFTSGSVDQTSKNIEKWCELLEVCVLESTQILIWDVLLSSMLRILIFFWISHWLEVVVSCFLHDDSIFSVYA